MNPGIVRRAGLLSWLMTLAGLPAGTRAQESPGLLPIEFQHSLEYRWLGKPVLRERALDDLNDPATWQFQGTGTLSFRTAWLVAAGDVPPGAAAAPGLAGAAAAHVLRVDVGMFTDSPAPTRNRLSTVNLRRPFNGEDWRGYNRLSLWIRPDISGFPMLPLQLVLHNEGEVRVPDAYGRDGIHYVTLRHGRWQQVVWEVEPLARDRVTSLEIGYWVNKLLAAPGDRVAFEIARLELQQVEADHVEGWRVAPGRFAFSHSGYASGSPKTALASGLAASEFRLFRLDGSIQGEVALAAPVRTVATRLGSFQLLDFSRVQEPGSYVLQAGSVRSQPFRIAGDVWHGTIRKALNFFFGERCGFEVPGSHGVCHRDWQATLGEQRLAMNGGWHDAGDLSQAGVNTAEATYAMFALAEALQESGGDPELVRRLIDEGSWGLDWLLRVRFPGGYRIHFAGNNLWTNGVVDDADDRVREARNNPNVNYLAAAAEAVAARVLRPSDPERAARSLRVAEEDWGYALTGIEGPESWNTTAFAATRMELAAVGALASLELHRTTGGAQYEAHAQEQAQVILDSQEQRFVGRELPLAGFFYTGPDRDTIFHQFHRGNDQAPVVALARLCERFPEHPDWMRWYAAVARYAEYQQQAAETTSPYEVLPAYVYHERDTVQVPDSGGLHMATRAAFLAQVRRGLPMGDGYYLKAFPVWFARRGNYGVLLSQAKALATAARLRRDSAALALAERQAQWVVGRNPFAQSTMYGEGYDWAQQYSVSSGDFVGALPVGMVTRGNDDVPYWPAANMYVYKEVWVHPVARWLWLLQDLPGGAGAAASPAAGVSPGLTVTSETTDAGTVTIRVQVRGRGAHRLELRSENLQLRTPGQTVNLGGGGSAGVTWQASVRDPAAPWFAVIVPDGAVGQRRDVHGALPRYTRKEPVQ
jgi:hypothetical protein